MRHLNIRGDAGAGHLDVRGYLGIFLFFPLRIEPRASQMLSKCFTIEPHPAPSTEAWTPYLWPLETGCSFCDPGIATGKFSTLPASNEKNPESNAGRLARPQGALQEVLPAPTWQGRWVDWTLGGPVAC